MSEIFTPGGRSVCGCDHKAPLLKKLRSTVFCQDLAGFYRVPNMSAEGIIDQIHVEMFDHRTGKLFGYDADWKVSKVPMPIDDDPSLTDDLFGQDARRSMNRFLSRSDKDFQYRLQMRMVPTVLLLHFVREINICRTSGMCSKS